MKTSTDIPPPLISVIVPVYNVEAYLRRCLDSLCQQTYRNLEIICVNDGSTDNSLAILHEYEARDSRIRVLNQPNRGVSSARNAALDVATGDWVAAVDPDDYVHPDAYHTALSYATPEIGFINFGVQVEAEPGAEDRIQALHEYLEVPYTGIQKITPEIVYNVPWNIWNKLYRRSVIEEHGLRYIQNLVLGEDQSFHMSYCAYVNKACFCPSQLYIYTIRQSSAAFSGLRDSLEQICAKAESHLTSLLKMLDGIAEVYHKEYLLDSYDSLFSFLFRRLDVMVQNRSFVTGQPLLWRARLLEQVGRYRMMELAQVGPLVNELAEQLRCAQRLCAILKSCEPSSTEYMPQERGLSHVAIPVDESHAGQAALLAKSFQHMTEAGHPVRIHFLCVNVSAYTREQLADVAEEHLGVCIHEIPEQIYLHLPPLREALPYAGYLKMALPWLLPDVERVLMLEAGLVLTGPLAPFHSIDMEGMPVSVLPNWPVQDREQGAARTGADRYVSSDVLLMDLRMLRKQNRAECWAAACMLRPSCYPNPETDSFNRAFRALMSELPGTWHEVLHQATPEELVTSAFSCGADLPGMPVNAERARSWNSPQHMASGQPSLQHSTEGFFTQYPRLRRQYYFCKIMTKLSWGKRRQHYMERLHSLRAVSRDIRLRLKDEWRKLGL